MVIPEEKVSHLMLPNCSHPFKTRAYKGSFQKTLNDKQNYILPCVEKHQF